MGLPLHDTAWAYDELRSHIGHNIVCVGYGDDVANVALECETCGMVLLDFDKIDRDGVGNCLYCGEKCWQGEMCDEQQAGGFNEQE